ncbi:MAG: hypothetical protein ACHQF3_08840, partial [Alphaproteobacteria bacterium]
MRRGPSTAARTAALAALAALAAAAGDALAQSVPQAQAGTEAESAAPAPPPAALTVPPAAPRPPLVAPAPAGKAPAAASSGQGAAKGGAAAPAPGTGAAAGDNVLGLPGQNNGMPVTVEAEQGIEWQQEKQEYIARGNAKAVRGDVTVYGQVLTAYY